MALRRVLAERIRAAGPISVAEYMRAALTHPTGGYYMRQDVFGPKGDFVTSPEISQIFGELVGVWMLSQWQALGSPSRVALVELGPGRGTLMADMLRVARKFPKFWSAVSVHLVERSPFLRSMQANALGVSGAGLVAPRTGKRLTAAAIGSVTWHDELAAVPGTAPILALAHEFFDAMPIHQLEYDARRKVWLERLVGLRADKPAAAPTDGSEPEPAFEWVLSPEPTPVAQRFLRPSATGESDATHGARIEISPVSWAIAQELSARVAQNRGAALIVDYGAPRAAQQSFRAIRAHKFEDPLSAPGDADLTADVDFAMLRRVTQAPTVHVGPCVTQAAFLEAMGVRERLAVLAASASRAGRDDLARSLADGVQRLTASSEMGTVYRALALTHSSLPVPPGFPSALAS